MNLLYPKLKRATIGYLLRCGMIGALIAGAYGIVHDQLTYTLSHEYFTGFKFFQFKDADPRGFFEPDSPVGMRVFVGLIGFLATWWVGLFTGWFLARASIRPDASHPGVRELMRHFALVLLSAFLFGIAGFLWGTWHPGFDGQFSDAFARVGHIHNFGYLGALVGLITALILVRRDRRQAIQETEDTIAKTSRKHHSS